MEVALEAAALDVTGRDDSRSRLGELLEPGVELVIQAMDLRRLRLSLPDVGVGDHVAYDPARRVPHRRGRDRDVHERSVLALAHRLEVVHPLAGPHPGEQLLALGALRGRRHRQVASADHLLA
jgi:hypothetical protein